MNNNLLLFLKGSLIMLGIVIVWLFIYVLIKSNISISDKREVTKVSPKKGDDD